MRKFLSIMAVVALLCAYSAFALGSGDDSETKVEKSDTTVTAEESDKQTEAETEAAADEKTTVNVGEKLTVGGLEINYVSCEENYTNFESYMAPENSNKVIRLYFECNNVGDDDEYISYFSFKCYADNQECDGFYVTNDDDNLSATLSAGRSAKGSVYFEVPADAQNIEVEYETDYWTDEKAIFIVK